MPRLAIAAITVLALAASCAGAVDLSFSDVLPSDPYAESVQKLASIGVIFGYPDGTFRGQQPVTRAELAVVIARMMRYYEAALPPQMTLRALLPGEKQEYVAIGIRDTLPYLRSRSVTVLSPGVDNLAAPATVDDVSRAVSQAMARLIEQVAPGYDGDDGMDEHPHEHGAP